MNKSQEITTPGGGCFWCLEAVFSELRGVEDVVSGYSGGSVPNPSYHQKYFMRNPDQMYCSVVISPKLAKFRKQYFTKLKNE
jgi:peptide-methionine (S)-S-oxide reductase